MDSNIQENGLMEFDKAKDFGTQKIEQKVIQVNGKMVKFVDMVNIRIKIILSIKDNLQTSRKMEKEKNHSQMGILIKDYTLKEFPQEKVNTFGIVV